MIQTILTHFMLTIMVVMAVWIMMAAEVGGGEEEDLEEDEVGLVALVVEDLVVEIGVVLEAALVALVEVVLEEDLVAKIMAEDSVIIQNLVEVLEIVVDLEEVEEEEVGDMEVEDMEEMVDLVMIQ